MGHPQRAFALFLMFASIMAIANFAVNPVFSQNYTTATSTQSTVGYNATTGFNRTVTIVKTYNTTGFTTSSSLITQIIVAFITSTTFVTYIQVTFTSSTSTLAYPAPSFHLEPNLKRPLRTDDFSTTASNIIPLLAIFTIAVCELVRRKTRKSENL